MKLGALFAGYGGLDLAVGAVLDVEPAWVSEIDPAACRVLAYRWPGVPNLGDITAVDWARVEPVDVLTGGWPCQPFSLAGKRLGEADERALWPCVADAVRVLRPRLVVLENVAAVAAAGELGRAVGDLAAVGYDAEWCCVRASDVGAPHRRARLFIIAWPAADAVQGGWGRRAGLVGAGWWAEPADGDIAAADAGGGGWDGRASDPIWRPVGRDATTRGSGVDWREYEAAIRRWERLTRPAPPPTILSAKGNPRLSGRFAEWMMGLPDGWVTDVPGVSNNDALRLCGNGVVPPQAEAALRWLLGQAEEEGAA